MIHKKIKQWYSHPSMELILKGSVLTLLARVMAVLLGFIVNLMIARSYGPDIIGLVAIIDTVLMFASLASLVGLDNAMLKLFPEFCHQDQDLNCHYALYRKIFKLIFLLSVIVSIFLYFSAHVLSESLFQKHDLEFLLMITAFFLVTKNIVVINAQVLRSFKRIYAFALMQMLPNMIFLILLTTLVQFVEDHYLPIYLFLVSLLFSALIGHFIVRQKKNVLRVSTTATYHHMLSLSLPMMLTASMSLISSQADIFMLGMFKSAADVGIYSIVFKIASLIIFVIVALNTMIAPTFAELYHAGRIDELKNIAYKSSQMIFWTTVPLSVAILLFGEFFLSLFGKEFETGYLALIFLIGAQVFNALVGPTGNFLNMTGHHRELVKIMIVSTLMNIVLNYALIPDYGINGAAFATMVSILFWNITATVYIYDKYGFYIGYLPFKTTKGKI